MTHATAVKEVAVLARLSISDEDIETATTEFNQTLALFDALSSVDTTQVTPMVNPLDAVQRLRIDSVETMLDLCCFLALTEDALSPMRRAYFLALTEHVFSPRRRAHFELGWVQNAELSSMS